MRPANEPVRSTPQRPAPAAGVKLPAGWPFQMTPSAKTWHRASMWVPAWLGTNTRSSLAPTPGAAPNCSYIAASAWADMVSRSGYGRMPPRSGVAWRPMGMPKL